MAEERSGWFYGTNTEYYTCGPFGTKEEALAAAQHNLDPEELSEASLARVVYAELDNLVPNAAEFFETMAERAFDQGAGDVPWPDPPKGIVEELDRFLTEKLVPWLRVKVGDPQFGRVAEEEPIVPEDQSGLLEP